MTDAVIAVILIAVLIFALNGARKRLKHGCCGGGAVKIRPRDKNLSRYEYKTKVYISGMTCPNCKLRVENAFNEKADCAAKVNLKKGFATVWTKHKPNEDFFKSTVSKHGYSVIRIEEF